MTTDPIHAPTKPAAPLGRAPDAATELAAATRSAVVESLKATASELQARPHEDMNHDWADRMAANLAAAGLLAAPAGDRLRLAYQSACGRAKGMREAATWIRDERDQCEAALADVACLLDRLDDSSQDYDTDMIRALLPRHVMASNRTPIASPVAPADDEATTVERMAAAAWSAYWNPSEAPWLEQSAARRAAWTAAIRAALAALREVQDA